ncbi:MAG: hypothetical protein ACR2PR_05700 [Pseudohongiellaceae bacterium]
MGLLVYGGEKASLEDLLIIMLVCISLPNKSQPPVFRVSHATDGVNLIVAIINHLLHPKLNIHEDAEVGEVIQHY